MSNMNKGMRAGTETFLAGYAPFVPWFDYQFCLMLRENEKLTLMDFYNYSMAWLEASDAVLVIPGYEKSKGTLREIARAKELGIPVFYSLEDLKATLPPEGGK